MWYLVFILVTGGQYDTVVSGPMTRKACEEVRVDINLTKVPDGQDVVLTCVPSVKEVVL